MAIAQAWPFGATTVSASVALAAAAGIRVFATGGIGGVHRGAEVTGDISADLDALANHPVVTVCAGAKAFLDLARTLEYLETVGVPVQYTPVDVGTDNGTLDIGSNDPDEATVTVALAGTGQEPAGGQCQLQARPSALVYGSVLQGTTATLTTIVVFLPVALVDGPGQFFLLRLAIPIGVSLSASLIVALVFVPLAVYLTLPGSQNRQENTWFRRSHDRVNRWMANARSTS